MGKSTEKKLARLKETAKRLADNYYRRGLEIERLRDESRSKEHERIELTQEIEDLKAVVRAKDMLIDGLKAGAKKPRKKQKKK